MQLKKIEKLCKERKSILVMRDVDDMGHFRTFIGDGVAMYEVQGMEDVIGGDLLLTIFDVKPGDRDDWTCSEIDGASNHKFVANVMEGDREAERVGPAIVYRGEELEAYHSAGTLIWINAKYWAPLRDEIKNGEIRVCMRQDVNGLIVKRGMGITVACIAAYAQPDEDDITNSLHELWKKVCANGERQKGAAV